MADVVIRVDGVGKRYRIGGQQGPYKTFREALIQAVRAPLQHLTQRSSADNTFWALKDVSFEVKRGEVLGVIGRNGAGKSTLLKLLSRITEPTTGAIYMRGRVGALLEVGTGFHHELTGRENVYLSGAILGMTRAEISRKFDEIVAFSGVEQFIDTPVKRYSSGMGLRLGFAVAAHLEPEILVVDEVLAVGDAEFQKKCLGKMSSVASEGRTVLFVSHNMSAVNNLCSRVLLLNKGTIERLGNTSEVITSYLLTDTISMATDLLLRPRSGKYQKLIQSAKVWSGDKNTSNITTFGLLRLDVTCQISEEATGELSLGFTISDAMESIVFASHYNQYNSCTVKSAGSVSFSVTFDELPLTPGLYHIDLYLVRNKYDVDFVPHAVSFDVVWNADLPLNYPPLRSWGSTFTQVKWTAREEL